MPVSFMFILFPYKKDMVGYRKKCTGMQLFYGAEPFVNGCVLSLVLKHLNTTYNLSFIAASQNKLFWLSGSTKHFLTLLNKRCFVFIDRRPDRRTDRTTDRRTRFYSVSGAISIRRLNLLNYYAFSMCKFEVLTLWVFVIFDIFGFLFS